jgi:hypothetical protein
VIGVPTRECRHRDDVPSDIRELFWRIAAHDPAAMLWCSGEPITFCVLPRARVQPEWHRVVDNVELRAEARRLIVKYEWPMANDGGPDAVLVLAPAY